MDDHLNEEKHKVGMIDLPNDMLTEVLTKVASSSFTDLFKAKLTCRYYVGWQRGIISSNKCRWRRFRILGVQMRKLCS
jgi:hypothetical protein